MNAMRMCGPGQAIVGRTLLRGLSLRQLLRLSTLRDARVLAGHGGLDRAVKHLNVMSVPEILPWVKESELLLTTGYPLPTSAEQMTNLVIELHARRLAALAIKRDKYVAQLPEESLSRADQLSFPILEIPRDVAFDDILSQVLIDIANREAATLIRAEEIHRAFVQIVLSGGGLAEITQEIAAFLTAAVVVLDGEEHVLAQAGLDKVSDRLAAAGLLDGSGRVKVDAGRESGEYMVGDIRVAAVPVSAGALHYGRIIAVDLGQSLPDDTVVVLERAATVAALDVTKKLAVDAVERKYQSDFLHDLLAGRADRIGDVGARSAVLGWNLDRPLVVIVAEPEGSKLREGTENRLSRDRLQGRLTDSWIRVVRAHDHRAGAAAFTREFVAIVGPDEVDPRKLAAAVTREVGHEFWYGVSRTVPSIRHLPEAYKQASRALTVARQAGRPGTVTTFESLGVLRLLSLVEDVDELRSFMADTLGPVLAFQPHERQDLLRTITVLIDCNMNATEASHKLHFHYNTVRYRIAKLERLLGPFSTDRHLCHRISVALDIIQMRGLGPH